MQCSAVKCSEVQSNIVHFNAVPLAGHNVWISHRVGDGDISGQKGDNEDITGYIWTNIRIYLDVSGY